MDQYGASTRGAANKLVVTLDDQPRAIDAEGNESSLPLALEAAASEMRTWEVSGVDERWAGVCISLANEILFVKTDVFFDISPKWPEDTAVQLGSGVGSNAGQFVFPLSFDAGLDGRIYVLDAGNTRIQVFDLEGNYLTQWGSAGSGTGEFHFGTGRSP